MGRKREVARRELTIGERQLGESGPDITGPADLIDEPVNPLDRAPLQGERIVLTEDGDGAGKRA
jgi:hypothetical protein